MVESKNFDTNINMSEETFNIVSSPGRAFMRGFVQGYTSPLIIFPAKITITHHGGVRRSFRAVGDALNRNFKLSVNDYDGRRPKK